MKEQQHAVRTSYRYEQQDGKGDTIAHVEVRPNPLGGLWLTNLWVHPDYRGQGRATYLMQHALGDWGDQELFLTVDPYTDQPLSATVLRGFYADFGFEDTTVPGVMRRPTPSRPLHP